MKKTTIGLCLGAMLFGAGCMNPVQTLSPPIAVPQQAPAVPSVTVQTAPVWDWSVVSETSSTKTVKVESKMATSTRGFTFSYPKNTVGFQVGSAFGSDEPGDFSLVLTSPMGAKEPAGTTLTILAGSTFCQYGPTNEFMNHSDPAGQKDVGNGTLDYAVAAYDNAGGNGQAGETYSGSVDGICYVMPLFSDRTIQQDAYDKNIAAMREVLQTVKFF